MQKNKLKGYYNAVSRYDWVLRLPLINPFEIPKLRSIILNKGVGSKVVVNKKNILPCLLYLELVAARRAYITKAKKSIDQFKLRQSTPIGCKISLRGNNAYLFLDKLILRTIPKAAAADAAPSGNPVIQRPLYAYGIKDLCLYGEILKMPESIDEDLGGFDIIFKYHHFYPFYVRAFVPRAQKGYLPQQSQNKGFLGYAFGQPILRYKRLQSLNKNVPNMGSFGQIYFFNE